MQILVHRILLRSKSRGLLAESHPWHCPQAPVCLRQGAPGISRRTGFTPATRTREAGGPEHDSQARCNSDLELI